MFTRLVGSNRALRRRTMTPGALILSTIVHASLLVGAAAATIRPSEAGDGMERVTLLEIVPTSGSPAAGSASVPRAGGSVVSPPRLIADTGIEGEVVAELVVLADGSVELSTLRLISATHEGLEPAARSMLVELRFAPGTMEGEPVPVLTRLPIKLRVGG